MLQRLWLDDLRPATRRAAAPPPTAVAEPTGDGGA